MVLLPEVLKILRTSNGSFYRKYRYHRDAPDPIAIPGKGLAWFAGEWEAFLERLGRRQYADMSHDKAAHREKKAA
jgi:predicted DNA-binding transcriptional regulator AlpA